MVDSILASTELRENLQQVKGQHPAAATEAPPLPPQGMEGVATYGMGGGGGSSGSSPNKTQESEGLLFVLYVYNYCT